MNTAAGKHPSALFMQMDVTPVKSSVASPIVFFCDFIYFPKFAFLVTVFLKKNPLLGPLYRNHYLVKNTSSFRQYDSFVIMQNVKTVINIRHFTTVCDSVNVT